MNTIHTILDGLSLPTVNIAPEDLQELKTLPDELLEFLSPNNRFTSARFDALYERLESFEALGHRLEHEGYYAQTFPMFERLAESGEPFDLKQEMLQMFGSLREISSPDFSTSSMTQLETLLQDLDFQYPTFSLENEQVQLRFENGQNILLPTRPVPAEDDPWPDLIHPYLEFIQEEEIPSITPFESFQHCIHAVKEEILHQRSILRDEGGMLTQGAEVVVALVVSLIVAAVSLIAVAIGAVLVNINCTTQNTQYVPPPPGSVGPGSFVSSNIGCAIGGALIALGSLGLFGGLGVGSQKIPTHNHIPPFNTTTKPLFVGTP